MYTMGKAYPQHQTDDVMSQLPVALKICFLVFLAWILTYFDLTILSIIPWLMLLAVVNRDPAKLLSALLAGEIMIGANSWSIGPISVPIILVGICLLSKPYRRFASIHRNKIFLLLAILMVYRFVSYYLYFEQFKLTPLNAVLLFIITALYWKNTEKNLAVLSWCIAIATTILLSISILFMMAHSFLPLNHSPFGNPRQIGFFGLLCLPFLVMLIKLASRKKIVIVWFCRGVLLLSLVFNLYTNSRLNIGILFLFLLLVGVFNLERNLVNRKLIFFAIVLTMFSYKPQQIMENLFVRSNVGNVANLRIETLSDLVGTDVNGFLSGRGTMYVNGVGMFLDHPMFGNGYLSWVNINSRYNSWLTTDRSRGKSMHSVWLQVLAETGIIGFGFYFAILGTFALKGFRLLISSRHENAPIIAGIGCFALFTGLFMLLGGTLDNHSLLYRQPIVVMGIVAAGLLPSGHSISRRYRNQKVCPLYANASESTSKDRES